MERMSIACGDYDLLRPLLEGTVAVDSVELEWHNLRIEEILPRMLRTEDFDIAEMSLSVSYLVRERGFPDFVSLPIFPSRVFRHSCIFVNVNSGISSLSDLVGKRVGMRNYHRLAAAVWFRGLLQEDYGIGPADINWVLEEQGPPGLKDRIPLDGADKLSIESAPAGTDLDTLLSEGRIDALLAVRLPEAFLRGDDRVARLFPNYREVEQQFFQRTGHFPIMHNLVIRREIFERMPEVGFALCEAAEASKRMVYAHQYDVDASHSSLAWFVGYLEEERDVLGDDPWSYGVTTNASSLDTFGRYVYEQGITKRAITATELFDEVPWDPSQPVSLTRAG